MGLLPPSPFGEPPRFALCMTESEKTAVSLTAAATPQRLDALLYSRLGFVRRREPTATYGPAARDDIRAPGRRRRNWPGAPPTHSLRGAILGRLPQPS